MVEARLLFAGLLGQNLSVTLTAEQTHAAFAPLAQADLLSNVDRRDPCIDALSALAKRRVALAQQIIDAHESVITRACSFHCPTPLIPTMTADE
ncbi:hypothetical protein F0169_10090 [Pseudomonas sp. MAFF 212408]|uniref:Uncharacterized protein n=1 Tax=Pseudomonas kitaguniensis TaxID=2607908 RepID=A0A5N7KJJ8_9PSED|nr:hypothetical protein [Pseudomonas kitaguniensis]MPR02387.1 hypothetical protein [Pseudomonas kitaguniensis]